MLRCQGEQCIDILKDELKGLFQRYIGLDTPVYLTAYQFVPEFLFRQLRNVRLRFCFHGYLFGVSLTTKG